jgi:dihydroflavonol-4-reductase
MSKKVLVTGANGFLAANIVRELLSQDYQVRGMMRKNADMRSLEGVSVESFYGNITNEADVDEAVAGCEVVIHVAADTSQRYDTAGPLRKVNVEATRLFVEASKRHHVRRFIFISTGNTIDFGTKEDPGHEGNPLGKLFERSGYAISKLEAEKLILDEVERNGFNAVIMNPTFMIGPYDAKPSSGRIFTMMYPNRVVFIPKGGKNFTPVKDAAAAICNAIDHGKAGERYLIAGKNLTYPEFLEIVKQGKKYLQIIIPSWVLITVGAYGSLLRKLGVPFELSLNNARILCADDFYTGAKAIKELNMPQTPIPVAVNEAIGWFKEHGML